MRMLDLFSGIGGFSLAAQWVWGDDLDIVSFCEIDPFCQKVLKKHWPDVPICDDIRKIRGSDYESVDLLTGGFPCQPFSTAGKRRGKDDDRYLWPEMLKVIRETGPDWVVGENVAGFVNMALDDCTADLEREGYEVQAFVIPACAVNAPHRRDRVWIVGHSTNSRCRKGPALKAETGRLSQPEQNRKLQGRPEGLCGVNADSDVQHDFRGPKPQQPASPCGQAWLEHSGICTDVSDAIGQRQQGQGMPVYSGHPEKNGKRQTDESFNGRIGNQWTVEPQLGRVAHGIPNRVDRLKSLGNAIVPQVAAVIFQAIKEIEKERTL